MDSTNQWQTPVTYVGTATSHFQSEPGNYDASDWDREVRNKLNAQGRTCIKPDLKSAVLPALLTNQAYYAKRSQELGCNMFRFSFDLPRLVPKRGYFNEALMFEYIRFLVRLRLSGHEPLVTLHHFTMPKSLMTCG
ncbi:MAG TPA: family 1 glycosylhydrolase, partial [Candidatus Paceibacterota bacterium]|nr:family 1 glycosylhydrolase [Candidatus Paceibacterota bacterium]